MSSISPTPTANGPFRQRPWAELPVELLHAISSNLRRIPDYISFRSVCRSWRSAANPARLPHQPVLLLLPYDPASDARAFFDVTSGHHFLRHLPEACDKYVCGSGFGWLVLMDADSALSLWNPFTRATIDLPRPFSLPSYLGIRFPLFEENRRDDHNLVIVNGQVRKGYPLRVSVSSRPGASDCTVVVVLAESKDFAYCRLGDEEWTVAKTTSASNVASVVLHEGRFYVFDDEGAGLVLEYPPPPGQFASLIPAPQFGYSFLINRLYVVLDGERLLMVLYYDQLDGHDGEGEHVEEIKGKVGVFVLDLHGEDLEWMEVGTVGDSVLFLSGAHSTVACVVRDLAGCREDTIYFSSLCHSTKGKLQPGVPHIEMYDMSTNQFQVIKCPWLVITDGFPNATWITPSIDFPSGIVNQGT